MNIKKDNRGGARVGTGPKPKQPEEKKVVVQFYVKEKFAEIAKAKIQPIVNKINSKK